MARSNALNTVVGGVLVLAAWSTAAATDGAMARGADTSHELGKIKVETLREISDMAASRRNADVLWLHNDGDSGRVFAVSKSGKLVAVVEVGVAIHDLEDMAIGPGPAKETEYIYLGDIGDNKARRREVGVVRFPEPALSGPRGQTIEVADAEVIRLSYPDGPHDAEAMFVDPLSGDLFIVTKEKGGARVYSAAAHVLRDGAAIKLTAAGELEVDEVSAGAISFDGSRVLLRREKQGWLWDRQPGEGVAAALGREPQKVPVLGKRQGPNGESVTFSPAGNSYFTVSEGKKQSIYEFALPPADDAAGQ